MNNIQELIERLRQDAKAMEYNFPAMAERINKAIAELESMQASSSRLFSFAIAHIKELEGDLMTCKQTRGAAISREKEAAQNMSAIAKENKRLDAALAEAKKSFERITEVNWGYDGDCGSANIAECAIMDIDKARAGE